MTKYDEEKEDIDPNPNIDLMDNDINLEEMGEKI